VVSDQGPGIPPHERQLVFERFFRSDSARAMPGSGLGLAIVKQVVLKHGGSISIEDTVPGRRPPGTTFRVVLPGSPMLAGGMPATPMNVAAGGTAASNAPKAARASNTVTGGSQSAQAGW
jgi:two-component system sensor histidine kinase MprB